MSSSHHDGAASDHAPAESSKGKGKQRPAPINIAKARGYGEGSASGVQAVHNPVDDDEADGNLNENRALANQNNRASSVYGDGPWPDDMDSISPLHIPRRGEMQDLHMLQAYTEWRDEHQPLIPTLRTAVRTGSAEERRNSAGAQIRSSTATLFQPTLPPRQANQRIPRSRTAGDLPTPVAPASNPRPVNDETDPYTPITPYTGGHDQLHTKTLFGPGGWLEDTAAEGFGRPKPETQKSNGLLGNIKRMAKEFTENTAFKQGRSSRVSTVQRVTISLDAREQNLLYADLEFTLSNALDTYIHAQLNGGRLEANKLKRVADAWAARGRPRVIGFRYDLETQIELVLSHVMDFRFYGTIATDPPAMLGLLHAMKTDARSIRLHTYCHPDTVIAKHIMDSQALLHMLGSAEACRRAIEKCAIMFRAITEREKIRRQLGERYGPEVLEQQRDEGNQPQSSEQQQSPQQPPQQPQPSQQQQQVRFASDTYDNSDGYGDDDDLSTIPPPYEMRGVSASMSLSEIASVQGTGRDYQARLQSRLQSNGQPGRAQDQSQGELHQAQQSHDRQQQRQFSGPILEPRTYNPSRDGSACRR
ncbi:hypothetical protein F4780DRAFT_765656 [Xylariomycetidae sp. FL0641]|nr:hypothetical protein F4780DRAFT_765656 [Xylariomycetidae sp. FL0641]